METTKRHLVMVTGRYPRPCDLKHSHLSEGCSQMSIRKHRQMSTEVLSEFHAVLGAGTVAGVFSKDGKPMLATLDSVRSEDPSHSKPERGERSLESTFHGSVSTGINQRPYSVTAVNDEVTEKSVEAVFLVV